jgi:hypothetical protein
MADELNGMGILYREVLVSSGFSVVEENPGIYRVSGIVGGERIDGRLGAEDFNNETKKLKYILGKISRSSGERGHQEHRIPDLSD